MRGLASEECVLEWPLDRIEHLGLRLRQDARKVTQESLLGKSPLIPSNRMPAVAGGVALSLGRWPRSTSEEVRRSA